MPRAGLTTAAVVDAAARMIDERPDESLSLATLAESLGVKPPSLYKHVDGVEGLRRRVMLRAKGEFADVLTDAAVGTSGADALRAFATAYRRWAESHPAQYALTVRAPRSGDADDEEVSARLAGIVYRVIAGFDIGGDDLIDAARFVRSALHGFVDLETSGAFELPAATERSFDRAVASVAGALADWGRAA
ncbi:TetR-like C-terminal domain-containing protein [Herbiconiux sp. KACC 21604]|uniref:TetR-like C-terminal domain-containing protein n=1 Tax=unclassified Herbiconiux TaxID=2618217 RepID=UPI001491162D|nr:TetR-like C-terminal domain-containing protein [Herbiconiux sp. SALV-R1]QJU52733.1 WHG domain-containing protein [Herbiconiux sp. SALV-R1]WPO87634.1 TetR-like C-terminal domain-containing protein [Herbiconiux sp. KACC 21604]